MGGTIGVPILQLSRVLFSCCDMSHNSLDILLKLVNSLEYKAIGIGKMNESHLCIFHHSHVGRTKQVDAKLTYGCHPDWRAALTRHDLMYNSPCDWQSKQSPLSPRLRLLLELLERLLERLQELSASLPTATSDTLERRLDRPVICPKEVVTER